jgi:hypothetical protein
MTSAESDSPESKIREALDELFNDGWWDGHACGRDEQSLELEERVALIDTYVKEVMMIYEGNCWK